VQYIIISPVRNEAQHLPLTIESVAAQSQRPQRWVLVNDGSNDETSAVLAKAAAAHPWILTLNRADRGCRQAGRGVMEAFNDGYEVVKDQAWQFLVKLDGDVSFSPEYFEQCLGEFQKDPRLGIGGGLVCTQRNGQWEAESRVDPAFHVRGATKIYRRECWGQIGGLVCTEGWDTLDEVKANMCGWKTRTFTHLRLCHHRPAGRAYGTWKNWLKNGQANYVAGYHPLFMAVKCLRRVFAPPYGIGAVGLMVGFCRGYLKRVPQVSDPELIRFFRQQQMNRLAGRKSLWDL